MKTMSLRTGSEVLTAAVMKSSIFWDITARSPLKARNQHEAPACYLAPSLFFNPEDGGDKLLRNIGYLSVDYTILYIRTQYISVSLHRQPLKGHALTERVRSRFVIPHMYPGGVWFESRP
jgi:hypothetical protein